MCKDVISGDNPIVGEVTNLGEYRNDVRIGFIITHRPNKMPVELVKKWKLETCKGSRNPNTRRSVVVPMVMLELAAWVAGSKPVCSWCVNMRCLERKSDRVGRVERREEMIPALEVVSLAL